MKKSKRIVIAIYSHPEFYPPILNLIASLSGAFDNIIVVSRNVLISDWDYPSNVQLVVTGAYTDIRASEKVSTFKKILTFINYTVVLWSILVRYRPNIVHLNDVIPLLSYRIARLFSFRKPKVWYHNHDIPEIEKVRKFSIGWIATKSQNTFFQSIDIFSLPADDRKKHFPLHRFRGDYFFLPNLPSKEIYNTYETVRYDSSFINIVYQGTVSTGHALEVLCSLAGCIVSGKIIKIHIIGSITADYREKLLSCIQGIGNFNYVVFYGRIPYKLLPDITRSCDIGVAVSEPLGIIYQTGGTASNKIYEYAACALPILYYDSAHYRKHLGSFEWAYPVCVNETSIRKALEQIIARGASLSRLARFDFESELNYEKKFQPILELILKNIDNNTKYH